MQCEYIQPIITWLILSQSAIHVYIHYYILSLIVLDTSGHGLVTSFLLGKAANVSISLPKAIN